MGLIEKLLKREVDIEKLEKNRDIERLLKLLKQELKSTKDLEVRVKGV